MRELAGPRTANGSFRSKSNLIRPIGSRFSTGSGSSSSSSRFAKRTMKYLASLAIIALMLFRASTACAQTPPLSEATPQVAALAFGTVIDSKNVGAYTRFLPAAAESAVRHGFTIRVVPTKRLDWSAGFTQATEKYSSQVGLLLNRMDGVVVAGAAPVAPAFGTRLISCAATRRRCTMTGLIRSGSEERGAVRGTSYRSVLRPGNMLAGLADSANGVRPENTDLVVLEFARGSPLRRRTGSGKIHPLRTIGVRPATNSVVSSQPNPISTQRYRRSNQPVVSHSSTRKGSHSGTCTTRPRYALGAQRSF